MGIHSVEVMKMKVLLIGQVVSQGIIPEEQVPSVILEGLLEYRLDARTEQAYGFAGEWGGILICNVDTAQELDEYVSLNPMAEVIQWEVHNVSNLDETISVMEKLEKHAQAKRKAA